MSSRVWSILRPDRLHSCCCCFPHNPLQFESVELNHDVSETAADITKFLLTLPVDRINHPRWCCSWHAIVVQVVYQVRWHTVRNCTVILVSLWDIKTMPTGPGMQSCSMQDGHLFEEAIDKPVQYQVRHSRRPQLSPQLCNAGDTLCLLFTFRKKLKRFRQ